MKILKNIIDNIEEYMCASLIAVMILTLAAQVCVRTFTGSGLAWSEELSRYSFVWAVFCGMALGCKKLLHVRITAQFLLFPKNIRLYSRIIADAIWVAFNIFLIYQSILLIQEGFEFPETSPALHWTMAYVEMIIPVSFALSTVRILAVYWSNFRNHTAYQLIRDIDGGE